MPDSSTYLSGFFALLFLSAFAKILTTLSIVRFGLGLSSAGFGLVVLVLSAALSLVILQPQIERAGGFDRFFSSALNSGAARWESEFRPFLEKHAHDAVEQKFQDLALRMRATAAAPEADPAQDAAQPAQAEEEPRAALRSGIEFPVLVAAFLVSELKEAFQLGFILLVPFLVLDLLVTNVLLLLGVTQLPHAVIALPLKILLFFAVDGWTLLSEKLIAGYL